MKAETSHQEACCSYMRIELYMMYIWELELHTKRHDMMRAITLHQEV